MKRLALLLICGLFLGCSGDSQSSGGIAFTTLSPLWNFLHRLPTSSHLRAVRFPNANVGWIAGEGSTILRTDDGGATWTLQEHEPRASTGDIDAFDALDAFNAQAVGDDGGTAGRWWTTYDAGVRWTAQNTGAVSFDPFTGVDIVDINLGITLTQSGIVRRVSSGEEFIFSVGVAGTYHDIQFPVDGNIGYVCGAGGAIFKSLLGGSNWTAQASGTTAALYSIWFPADTIVGWICGADGTILKTLDGGTTWNPQTSGLGAGTALRSIHFPENFLIGYTCGDGGVILKTVDGGGTWNPQTSNTTQNLYGIWFITANIGYAVGDYGTVLKTSDGGATWNNLTTGDLADFNAADFTADGEVGYAVGDTGVIRRTVDAGQTWDVQDVAITGNLNDVSVPTDGTVAYACGDGGVILKTTTGGITWSLMTSGTTVNLLAILFPTSTSAGYCVGTGGTILRTTDGINWVPLTSGTAVTLRDIAAPMTGTTAYVCGDSGTILKTSNWGVTWLPLSFPDPVQLNAVACPSDVFIFAAASNGNFYRSLGGTPPWGLVASGTANTAMVFTGTSDGWIVDGLIRTTSNGGSSFSTSGEHAAYALTDIWMTVDRTVGYAVGPNGTILKTTTGGR